MTPATPAAEPEAWLQRAVASGRIHSAYLLSGPGPAPREAAIRFARALACGGGDPPCGSCSSCSRSEGREEIPLDGSGRKGPLYRHIGDHADLYWLERGADDTRVRIGQIRALQGALRLQSQEGGRRVAVIADAEWLNQEAQNALLRLLEEPPAQTSLVLVSASSAGLLPTVRSRCQRVVFRAERPERLLGPLASPEILAIVEQLEGLTDATVPELLDWAERFRGARAVAAAGVQELLSTAGAWLRDRVIDRANSGSRALDPELAAFSTLQACRKSLAQRNANPQMVAERALFALRATARR